MASLTRKRRRPDFDLGIGLKTSLDFAKKPRTGVCAVKNTRRTRRNSYESNSSDGESSHSSLDDFRQQAPTHMMEDDQEVTFKKTPASPVERKPAFAILRSINRQDGCGEEKNKIGTVVTHQNKVNKCEPKLVEKSTPTTKNNVDEEVDDRETNRRSPNGFLLPDPLPRGEVLRDSLKQEWVLGKAIGVGGFGELYLASTRNSQGSLGSENFVIKIEPHSNGPLFVEVHFYIRATRLQQLQSFKQQESLNHLGIPRYIASGAHVKGNQKYRFLVMERFGSDLQRILDNSAGGRFTDKTVCEVALQVVDALQYMHEQGYVHKDVKASNLLVGLGMEGQHKVHLVDFGLCSRYTIGNIHKQYTHDLRWAHEGTLEYTSRDSHIGCSSRRGDIEVLLYNLIEWWGGCLPWDRDYARPEIAKSAKFRAFANPHKFLRHCFRHCPSGGGYPQLLNRLMRYIQTLRFEEEPQYHLLRQMIKQQMTELHLVPNGRLEFQLGRPNANRPGSVGSSQEEQESADYLCPVPADTRVSTVFDKLCVSQRTWNVNREAFWAARDEQSLTNPTQAMLDVQTAIRERNANTNTTRKRQKSGNYVGDGPENTSAMLQVIRRRKMRLMSEEAEINGYTHIMDSPLSLDKMDKLSTPRPSPYRDALLGPQQSVLSGVTVPIPASVLLSPDWMSKTLSQSNKMSPKKTSANCNKKSAGGGDQMPTIRSGRSTRELMRLADFLADPATRRKTRSETESREQEGQRAAFRFGLGNMKYYLRQFSDSLTSIF